MAVPSSPPTAFPNTVTPFGRSPELLAEAILSTPSEITPIFMPAPDCE